MAAARDESASGGNRRTLGIIFLTLFLDLVGFSIIFPLFPAMLDYYLPEGGSGGLLGALVAPLERFAESTGVGNPRFMTAVLFGGILGSLYSILQFLFAPVWGALSDRIGRRPVLLLTIAGLALSYLCWFFASSFWLLVAARVLGGMMGGNLSVVTAAVADITPREKRASGMAVIGIAFGLGFIVGPAIGGLGAGINLLDANPGLERLGVNPFSVPALISFVLAVVNLAWVYRRFAETRPAGDASAAGATRGFAFVRMLRSPEAAVRRTNLVYLLFMLAFSGMEFTLTFLAVERFAFTPAKNGMMFLFIGFILILIQGGVVRRLAQPVGEKRLAVTGLACAVVALFGLAGANDLLLFFGALGVMATSIGLISPTLSALVSLYSPERDQGANLGSFRSVGSLARAIGPLVAALAYFRLGSATTYACFGVFLVLPLVISLGLPKVKH